MPLLNSYVIWNNKGGVGKTTLTFHMATEYARSHFYQKVLVIDLCPQANVSMALLGSGSNTERIKQLVSQKKTISFYLKAVTDAGLSFPPQNFLTHVSDFNNAIPLNVELLCGDTHLELAARSLEQKRQVKPDVYGNPSDPAWESITSCVRYFIEGDGNVMGVTATRITDWVVFIDTNPSFSVYTEMALLAAQRLIIPINGDDFSREALKTLLHLVYGISTDEVPQDFQFYEEKLTFSYKAKQFNVRLPKIHLLVHSRTTRYNLRSAQAFKLSALSSFEVLKHAFLSGDAGCCFVTKFPPFKPKTDLEIQQEYFKDMYDFHTVGIVALHKGWPFGNFSSLNRVSFENGTVKLLPEQIKQYLQCLQELVAKL